MSGARALALAAALALMAPAAAQARNPITGKLDKNGFTVIAMGRDGRVTQAEAKAGGAFSILPPATRVTLHLRSKAGKYFGPVVISGRAKTLVMGVHHGVDLGTVHVATGWARVRKPPPAAKRDTSFKARGRQGRPLGAGVFGRFELSTGDGAKEPGADGDGDGVPNAVDVDDDGNLILDTVDAGAPVAGSSGQTVVASVLRAPLAGSLNVNGGADVSGDVLDDLLKGAGALSFPLPGTAERTLDCGGLSYCGQKVPMTAAEGTTPRTFVLVPGANVRQIGPGDMFIERLPGRQVAGTLTYAYVTTPAVAAWADGTSLGPVIYPASDATPGSSGNPLVVHPRASDGHVVLQLAVWRPQRHAYPAEADNFIDLGHLRYSIVVDEAPVTPSGGGSGAPDPGPGVCPLASYAESDENLTGIGAAAHGVLLDASDDVTADPNRTLVFSIDLTSCIAATTLTWTPGQVLTVGLRAADASLGFAEQVLTLKLADAAE